MVWRGVDFAFLGIHLGCLYHLFYWPIATALRRLKQRSSEARLKHVVLYMILVNMIAAVDHSLTRIPTDGIQASVRLVELLLLLMGKSEHRVERWYAASVGIVVERHYDSVSHSLHRFIQASRDLTSFADYLKSFSSQMESTEERVTEISD